MRIYKFLRLVLSSTKFESVIVRYFSFGIFVLPFVYWKYSPVTHEVPKVWFFIYWSISLFIFSIVGLRRHNKVNYIYPLLVILFLVVAFLASIQGADLMKSIVGNYYRKDGLITLLALTSFYIFVSMYWKKSWWTMTTSSIGLSGILLSIWSVVFGIGYHIFGNYNLSGWLDGGISITFGNPNFLGGYLVVIFPFVLEFLSRTLSRCKSLFSFAIFIYILAILFTLSLGSLLSLIFFLALLVLEHSRKPLSLGIILVICMFISLGVYFGRLNYNVNPSAESRTRIFTKISLGILEKPILGYGWSNVDYAFEKVDWPIHFNDDVYVDKAHSTIIEIFATTGIVGLFLYLTIIIITLYQLLFVTKLKSKMSRVMFGSFILYIFHSQTNVISINEEIVFWLILGIIASNEYV